MTNLTFSAGTRLDRHPIRLRWYIARARGDCHLVFAQGVFKGSPGADLALWKSLPGMNRRAVFRFGPPARVTRPAICLVHIVSRLDARTGRGLVLPYCPPTKGAASELTRA